MKKKKEIEIRIPKGYEIEDLFDLDDSDFKEENPVIEEEVTILFE